MTIAEEKLADLRRHMVESHLRGRGIESEAILTAFAEIPRERFLPPELIEDCYADLPLPIGYSQTVSQPYIMALMVQELDVRADHKVLEIGAGSGYQTAVLSRLVDHVFSIERISELAERAIDALAGTNVDNVTICTQDGSLGWPEEAPFDRIISAAAAPSIPQPWIDQLADHGRIILPLGDRDHQILTSVEKHGGKVIRHEICGVRFVKLIGRHGWSEED